MTRPSAFQCSHCNRVCCWDCNAPDDSIAEVKTIGSRYCDAEPCIAAQRAECNCIECRAPGSKGHRRYSGIECKHRMGAVPLFRDGFEIVAIPEVAPSVPSGSWREMQPQAIDYGKFRYGRDIPIEMRPKLYDKILDDKGRFAVSIDAFVENPQLIDAIKRQEEESRRFVDRLTRVISEYEDDAAFKLIDAGVALERISRWSERGSTRCGFMVDFPPGGVDAEPYKACTISTELAPTENRWEFVVSIVWHGQWRHLAR